VFYANDCGLAGYRLSSPKPGSFQLEQQWFIARGGTTPIISHGVLYVARSGEVLVYRPGDHTVLWKGSGVGGIHWEYPLLAGERLFLTDEQGHILAYSL
jgi:hypothetical protein